MLHHLLFLNQNSWHIPHSSVTMRLFIAYLYSRYAVIRCTLDFNQRTPAPYRNAKLDITTEKFPSLSFLPSFLPYYCHNNWTSLSPDTSRYPASLEMYWSFGGTDWHDFTAQFCYYHTMKMISFICSETSIWFYQTARCHVRQESNIHRHRCENLWGDINFSSAHLMVHRAVRVGFVVKTRIMC